MDEQTQEIQGDTRGSEGVLEVTSFTITREQAAEMFKEAGFPRSPRQISRWCQSGELAAVKKPTATGLERYVINEQSIREKIEALRRRREEEERPHYEAVRPKGHTEPSPPAAYDPAELTTLRQENVVLKQRVSDQERLIGAVMDRLTDANRQLGSVQAKLAHREQEIARLQAPKPEGGQKGKSPLWRRILGR